MKLQSQLLPQGSTFVRQSSLGLALLCLLLLTPFSINNFIQGRPLLGAGSLAIVAVFAVNAWTILRYQRYLVGIVLVVLVPAVLLFLTLSIRNQGLIGVFWSYPALVAMYFLLPERSAWFANLAILAVAPPLAWRVLETPEASRFVVTLLMTGACAAIFVRVITRQQNKLKALATTDPLTGLLNRVLLPGSLEEATQRSRRTGEPMTLATVDVDHFKKVNDSLGHDVGDTVLQRIAERFTERVRTTDKVFRLGGEEFLLLFYGTDLASGLAVAEELREAIAEVPLVAERKVTVSAGVAMLEEDEEWAQWLKRSDNNLYRAKSQGRNQVVG